MTHLPVEDPYDRGSLVDRSVHYVRASPVLRIAFYVTLIDHVAAIVLVGLRWMPVEAGGAFALFSVLAWFFAVCLPVMNRTVRARLGAPATSYMGEMTEMFGRVVLSLATLLYTAIVAYGAAGGFGP
jgi:hypothetical protein